jgi:hypothetical protein
LGSVTEKSKIFAHSLFVQIGRFLPGFTVSIKNWENWAINDFLITSNIVVKIHQAVAPILPNIPASIVKRETKNTQAENSNPDRYNRAQGAVIKIASSKQLQLSVNPLNLILSDLHRASK